MPEWMPYALLAGLLLTVAVRIWAAVAGRTRPLDDEVNARCGSSDCRGLRTVHHVTASGIRCAECGHYPSTR